MQPASGTSPEELSVVGPVILIDASPARVIPVEPTGNLARGARGMPWIQSRWR